MSTIRKFVCPIPVSEKGEWKIDKFEVTEEAVKFQKMRSCNPSSMGRGVFEAGIYTKLMRNNEMVMSDTPDEIDDLRLIISVATGSVLINGLGLGILPMIISEKENVKEITIIEIDRDVIDLVGKYVEDRCKKYDTEITIIHADAFTWKPPKGKRYNAVWHDIWNYICEDNLSEMTKLHRKYGKRCDWQYSWMRDELVYKCGR